MSLQRVSASIPLAGDPIDPESLVPVFHDWIRTNAVEGLLIDVARYTHVPDGPGVMLIGHEGDYSLDLAAGRQAIRYTLKRDNDGTPAELVERTLRRARSAAARLEADADLRVSEDALVVQIFDRLSAPNSADTFARLASAVGDGVEALVGSRPAEIVHHDDDPRAPVGFVVRGLTPTAHAAR